MISTVFVTYKRLEDTKRTVESYFATVTGEHEVWIVDNCSDDGTQDWILQNPNGYSYGFSLLQQNWYPGHATNLGWDKLGGTHLLHRSDNDIEYLPGWCEEVMRQFEADPNLGQLGLRTLEEEGDHPNVGGNCVVRAEVFERVRWSEEPWRPGEKGEDYFFTTAVAEAGWNWKRVETPCIIHRGAQWPERPTDPYYKESWGARGHW